MEALQRRLEALEQQTEQLTRRTQSQEAHNRTLERRLWWWRCMACGLGVLCLLGQSFVSGTARDYTTEHIKGLVHRVERLAHRVDEELLTLGQ